MTLRFRSISEDDPGSKLKAVFDESWRSYRRWFLREGDAARPPYAQCIRALRTHMPQLVPVYERLVDLAGGGDMAARFLSLWRPTPYLSGCAQAVWTRGETALIRNYDYSPDFCDGLILRSRWLDRPVMAMTDCLWGVLDGVKDAGLCAALAFGGRKIVGSGFGITLVLRYVLEQADSIRDAVAILSRVPVHMAYNVTMVDAAGEFATVFVSPDRPAAVTRQPVSTNHQQKVEWPEQAKVTESVQRMRYLQTCLDDPEETRDSLTARFLQPPLYRTTYDRGWGTLYTAVYFAARRAVDFLWPDHTWSLSLDSFHEGTYRAQYRVPQEV